MKRRKGAVSVDVIYRVVGAGTRWMAGLGCDDEVSAIGPLGHPFPDPPPGQDVWLVAGGVGLPPLLWFAQSLIRRRRKVVLFIGAASKDLIPLEIERAEQSVRARNIPSLPIRLATDDGTLGFHGNVVDAVRTYASDPPSPEGNVIGYTCGPEPMMAGVAEFCRASGFRCYVCLERAMACGIGTCQSCVVPIRQTPVDTNWAYKLCCTDGPVFEAETVIWDACNL